MGGGPGSIFVVRNGQFLSSSSEFKLALLGQFGQELSKLNPVHVVMCGRNAQNRARRIKEVIQVEKVQPG